MFEAWIPIIEDGVSLFVRHRNQFENRFVFGVDNRDLLVDRISIAVENGLATFLPDPVPIARLCKGGLIFVAIPHEGAALGFGGPAACEKGCAGATHHQQKAEGLHGKARTHSLTAAAETLRRTIQHWHI
ncbi:hypothetical protein [Kaistia defluvii]|uniref:hypothetical protein n=1 Tax=Kaistia defluvii TaxID=410841 RepID=UPI00339799A5